MDSLPDEIWRDIFANFEGHLPSDKWWMYGVEIDTSPIKTLLSISRVCKKFHRIAEPLLYRTILIGAHENENKECFVQLTKRLVSNPQLGHDIRSITLDNDFEHGHDDVRKVLRSTWLSLDAPISFKKQLGKEIADYKMPGIAPLILALSPQVRLVDFTFDNASPCTSWILSGRPDLEIIVKEDYYGSNIELTEEDEQALKEYELGRGDTHANYGLPHLEEVRIRHSDCTDSHTPIDYLEPVLLHPNLKTLRLLGIGWLSSPISNFKFPNEPCNLETLELKECLFDDLSLKNILTRCKKLKWLSMETADARRDDRHLHDEEWDVDLSRIGNVLRSHGHNLEYFSLHTIEYDNWGFCNGRLGSLRNLKSLRHLKVILNSFTGRVRAPWETDQEQEIPLAEALPPTIETLHLHWDDEYYSHHEYKGFCDKHNGAVFKLLMAADSFPNLRKISMERYGGKREKGESEWDKSVDGWEVEVTQEHLWQRYSSTGCTRTLIYLTKTS
ncbi:uncharacterized protein NECHADRAFT_86995 [Fusarium vanettenii 77-13-4]|uniref:F-box domain-containing protein n=1 Tax=Fusarium vanettenii (strain ATCC MYA-4622 / CBS 123669 / FGSC 9596 / NRRL 45880 / 77-13-4) TaxID=660122 RepID=C7ZI75_FUSV7|nr:uncharacterized protein NECHADRAFT_86995 [Fusarium vanettenii 77-13-4]EEU36408.1 predicted protein [Fusarium vanettenii 77-13-4]